MIRVCLAGARGRMGQMLSQLIVAAGDLQLAAALERPGHPDLGQPVGPVALTDDPAAALAGAEVLLDFSLPAAVAGHAEQAGRAGVAVVTGTTGLTEEQLGALKEIAARVAVVHGSNMSRGVYALTALVRQAAAALSSGYDVEIVEAHHRHKVDAPSGTAGQLVQAVQSARGGQPVYGRAAARGEEEIGVAAIRGGDVVGEHQVFFLGTGEQLILTHRATTRAHFCAGALDAVRFVHGRAPGLYGMADVFEAGS